MGDSVQSIAGCSENFRGSGEWPATVPLLWWNQDGSDVGEGGPDVNAPGCRSGLAAASVVVLAGPCGTPALQRFCVHA